MIKYIALLICLLFTGCTVNGDYILSTPTVSYGGYYPYYGYSYPYYYNYGYPYYGYGYGGYGYGGYYGGWNRCRYWY